MSEEKTLEQRVYDLEKKVQELQRLLNGKADSQNVNKQISDLKFAIKNHRL